jgi:hypothetical protein
VRRRGDEVSQSVSVPKEYGGIVVGKHGKNLQRIGYTTLRLPHPLERVGVTSSAPLHTRLTHTHAHAIAGTLPMWRSLMATITRSTRACSASPSAARRRPSRTPSSRSSMPWYVRRDSRGLHALHLTLACRRVGVLNVRYNRSAVGWLHEGQVRGQLPYPQHRHRAAGARPVRSRQRSAGLWTRRHLLPATRGSERRAHTHLEALFMLSASSSIAIDVVCLCVMTS